MAGIGITNGHIIFLEHLHTRSMAFGLSVSYLRRPETIRVKRGVSGLYQWEGEDVLLAIRGVLGRVSLFARADFVVYP